MLTRNWHVLLSNLLMMPLYQNSHTIGDSKIGKLRLVKYTTDTPVLIQLPFTPISSYIRYGTHFAMCLPQSVASLDYNDAGRNLVGVAASLESTIPGYVGGAYMSGSTLTQPTYGGFGYIWFGSGTTPATENDYRLDNPNILCSRTLDLTDEENTVCPIYSTVDMDRVAGTMTFTLHLFCNSPTVTLNEVGMFKCITDQTITVPLPNSDSTTLVMYARDVLETPITLTQSQILKFNYTISTFDMGTESNWVVATE